MADQQLFRTDNPIRFFHTDAAAIVYYPKYFDMFQSSIEDWFTLVLGIDYSHLIMQRKVGLPSVDVQCRFIRPCRMGERLELEVHLEHLGNRSFTVVLKGMVDGEERLEGRVVIVTISLETYRSVLIPDDLLERLQAYRQLSEAAAATA